MCICVRIYTPISNIYNDLMRLLKHAMHQDTAMHMEQKCSTPISTRESTIFFSYNHSKVELFVFFCLFFIMIGSKFEKELHIYNFFFIKIEEDTL